MRLHRTGACMRYTGGIGAHVLGWTRRSQLTVTRGICLPSQAYQSNALRSPSTGGVLARYKARRETPPYTVYICNLVSGGNAVDRPQYYRLNTSRTRDRSIDLGKSRGNCPFNHPLFSLGRVFRIIFFSIVFSFSRCHFSNIRIICNSFGRILV